MEKELYNSQRTEMLAKAEKAIDEGKLKDFEKLEKDIKNLDEKFQAEAKAKANLKSLEEKKTIMEIENKEVKGTKIASFAESEENKMNNDMEYRKAFMNHVLKGTAIPNKFRNADETTKTGDASAVIPTTIVDRIIQRMESTGMILPLVTRTMYQGGVSIPVSTVRPVASWVAEGSGSDKQKLDVSGEISFKYHKLRCAVSMTLETSVMALDVFETLFVQCVADAMTKALEQAIISGDGVGKPKGIITETPADGQAITADGTIADLENAEAAEPLAYESNAVWCMHKTTFMHYATLKDANGQPIGRTNYGGAANAPERVLLGRTVVLCDYLPTYSADVEGVYAFMYDFGDYILNSNYDLTVKQYEDNDTDDIITKAIMIADGKVADAGSLVTLSK